jgi:hypothetical protein
MCNCTYTVWQFLINIGLLVHAVYFTLFVVHQEVEIHQDEFHKIPKKFHHRWFKYVSGFVLLINQHFDLCEVGNELLWL